MKYAMIDNVTGGTIAGLATKKYFILAGVILFGAISHAIEDARKDGWQGIGWFVANVFVAAFVGMLFAHIATILQPDFVLAAGGIGGYMGPASFKYIRQATLAKFGLGDVEAKKSKK